RRTAPRLIRTDDPAPTQSWRRQTTQPRPAYRDPSPTTARPNDQGLHRTPRRRRQNNARRRPPAQALPRPPPLPTTATGAADGLTRHRSINYAPWRRRALAHVRDLRSIWGGRIVVAL